MALLLILRFFVPFIAREISYSIAQGRQRAEFESAGKALENARLEDLSKAYQLVSQRVGPSVVHINIVGPTSVAADETSPFWGPRFQESRGQGSGVIVDEDGHIITNQHVIEGASEIKVALSDGRRVPATIVGTDSLTDLAVLKINEPNLIAARWGNSDELNVGAMVLAVGSPFGLEQSVTAGIVSAKHRTGRAGRAYQDFLQTDAAVNPGNSGGPLVDMRGQVVGINTAIVGDTYRGISFAIPSNVARDVYASLKDEGEVARGWLGVQLMDLDEFGAQQLGVVERDGAYVVDFVNEVIPSPAETAGMQVGDIVIRWNEEPIKDRATLSQMVAQTQIGTAAKVVVLRDGDEVELHVTLGRRPERFN
jgi:S1-C subfamily serine protease